MAAVPSLAKIPPRWIDLAPYMARYIAKNIVAAGLADKCQIQLAYAIGVAEPVSVRIDTFGTGKYPDDQIGKAVLETVDLTPNGIIRRLELRRPIYQETAAYGHFGCITGVTSKTWEKTDITEILREAIRRD